MTSHSPQRGLPRGRFFSSPLGEQGERARPFWARPPHRSKVGGPPTGDEGPQVPTLRSSQR